VPEVLQRNTGIINATLSPYYGNIKSGCFTIEEAPEAV